MIIGAGKMGEACIRHLAKKGTRSVLVSNRSYDRAVNLATEFGGRAVRFDECLTAMIEADIVVSSTGATQTILRREDIAALMPARANRPLFLIDIAVPRDIDPEVQQLENVYLYNVDHLETLVRENVKNREQELTRCQSIIRERTTALMAKLAAAPAKPYQPARATQPEWVLGGATAFQI